MENKVDIKIVETTLKDLKQIDDIQNMYTHKILSLDSIEKDMEINTYYYISAKLDDKVVAFAGISLLVDHADILGIAVDKSYARQKIGTKLLEHLTTICTKMGFDNIFLEVRESNTNAIKFYEKHGFKKIDARKNYYKDNSENALIYIKEL